MNKSILNQDQWLERVQLLTAEATPQRFQLFFNPTNINSLRLTKIGFQFFTTAFELKFTCCNLKTLIMPKYLLLLERNMTELYYIKGLSSIYTIDETLALYLHLNNYNLPKYLDAIENAK